MNELRAPFPYFGGKYAAASLIWDRLGNTPNYVEPFAGSLAVFLARPNVGKTETVNDADGFITNFWRAVSADPDEVAKHAADPIHEATLHARHRCLIDHRSELDGLCRDPDFFDAKIAGWWAWGKCWTIGDGWCREFSASIPSLGNGGTGLGRRDVDVSQWLGRLKRRLQRVRVCHGDFERVLSPSVTCRHGVTGVLLDPPYKSYEVTYHHRSTGAAERPRLGHVRTATIPISGLLYVVMRGGYELEGWTIVEWQNTRGGYANMNREGNANRARERIWFSPHCLEPVRQMTIGEAT